MLHKIPLNSGIEGIEIDFIFDQRPVPMENHEKYLIDVGTKIADARHALGMKEMTLAKAAGLSQGKISMIERGRYKSLKVATMLKLFECLNIPPHELP